jgi:hypothetical protein
MDKTDKIIVMDTVDKIAVCAMDDDSEFDPINSYTDSIWTAMTFESEEAAQAFIDKHNLTDCKVVII